MGIVNCSLIFIMSANRCSKAALGSMSKEAVLLPISQLSHFQELNELKKWVELMSSVLFVCEVLCRQAIFHFTLIGYESCKTVSFDNCMVLAFKI